MAHDHSRKPDDSDRSSSRNDDAKPGNVHCLGLTDILHERRQEDVLWTVGSGKRAATEPSLAFSSVRDDGSVLYNVWFSRQYSRRYDRGMQQSAAAPEQLQEQDQEQDQDQQEEESENSLCRRTTIAESCPRL